jgi:hypothetical protein
MIRNATRGRLCLEARADGGTLTQIGLILNYAFLAL